MTTPDHDPRVDVALRNLLHYTRQLELLVYSPDDTDTHEVVGVAEAALRAASPVVAVPIPEPRYITLLRATRDILKGASRGPYVKEVMSCTAIWDDAECDGACLLQDIEDWLEDEAAPSSPRQDGEPT